MNGIQGGIWYLKNEPRYYGIYALHFAKWSFTMHINIVFVNLELSPNILLYSLILLLQHLFIRHPQYYDTFLRDQPF